MSFGENRACAHRNRYMLKDEELRLKTTILIGESKAIPLGTTKYVEKILIQFSIKLFGTSFHGDYHIPGLGRAFLTLTNFKDGLLIKANRIGLVITPSNPLSFQEAIQSRKGNFKNL